MTDQEFIEQLKGKKITPDCFSHKEHLRLAYIQIRELGKDQAVIKVRQLIKDYVDHIGASDKYHDTMTVAAVHILAKQMENSDARSLDALLVETPELLCDFKGLIHEHYSPALLDSAKARVGFIEPDRKSFKMTDEK